MNNDFNENFNFENTNDENTENREYLTPAPDYAQDNTQSNESEAETDALNNIIFDFESTPTSFEENIFDDRSPDVVDTSFTPPVTEQPANNVDESEPATPLNYNPYNNTAPQNTQATPPTQNNGYYTHQYKNADGVYPPPTQIKKMNKGLKYGLIAAVTAVVLFFGVIATGVWGLTEYMNSGVTPSIERPGNNENPNSTQNNENSASEHNNYFTQTIPTTGILTIPEIAAKCIPSVVVIEVLDANALGSGFFIDNEGKIITNAHVVGNGTKFKITTNDGTEYTNVKLLGSDNATDIAVLEIIGSGDFKPIELGTSSNLVIGSKVIAIGHPYGKDLRNTVTDGIISAVRENIRLGEMSGTFIQTSAAVNQGNSGGPLVDEYGQLVGVVNMKVANASEGLGFAIPVDTALNVASELIEKGRIPRPMIGITGYYISSDEAQRDSVPTGIKIEEITPNSDLLSKGIKKGDIITQINDQSFNSMEDFNAKKAAYKIGDTIKLRIYSNNGTDGSYKDYDIALVDTNEQ